MKPPKEEAAVPAAEMPDMHEIDAIEDIEHSEGYRLVVQRLQDEIERRRTELEDDRPELATAKLRGYVMALRDVLRVPEILKGEFRDAIQTRGR